MPAPVLSALAKKLIEDARKSVDAAIHDSGEDAVIAEICALAASIDYPYLPDSIERITIDPIVNSMVAYLVKRGHSLVHEGPAEKSALPPGA